MNFWLLQAFQTINYYRWCTICKLYTRLVDPLMTWANKHLGSWHHMFNAISTQNKKMATQSDPNILRLSKGYHCPQQLYQIFYNKQFVRIRITAICYCGCPLAIIVFFFLCSLTILFKNLWFHLSTACVDV